MRLCARCGNVPRVDRAYCLACRRAASRKSDRKNRNGKPERLAKLRAVNVRWWIENGHTTHDRHQRWLRNNASKQREHRKRSNALRKAFRLGAPGWFTIEEIASQLLRQHHRCFWCSCDISGGLHTIDHYIPLARGGSNFAHNIVLACRSCNASKGNKPPDAFRIYLKLKLQKETIL